MFAFFWIRWGQTLSPFIFADKNASNHFFLLDPYLFVVSSLTLARECTTGFERNVLSLQRSICGSSIVTGISRWPLPATHTLSGIWKGYWGTDEGFHPLGPPWGVFPLSPCLCRFNPSHNPPKKRSQDLKFLIPEGIYFTLSVSPEVLQGLQRLSTGIPCPTSVLLNLSMGSESHFQPFHCMPSSSLQGPPRMPQTSQDILKLDSYVVYLLINSCSKNDMSGNCKGSAGRRQADDIRFCCTTGRQKWGRRKVHPGSSGVNWFLLRLAGCFLQLLQAKGSFYLEGIPTSVTKMHLLSCS